MYTDTRNRNASLDPYKHINHTEIYVDESRRATSGSRSYQLVVYVTVTTVHDG